MIRFGLLMPRRIPLRSRVHAFVGIDTDEVAAPGRTVMGSGEVQEALREKEHVVWVFFDDHKPSGDGDIAHLDVDAHVGSLGNRHSGKRGDGGGHVLCQGERG
jgi:hypothetical protein